MDTVGKREDGTNWESSTDIHTAMCKADSRGNLEYSTGSSAGCSVMAWRRGMGDEGCTHTYIHVADSFVCAAETTKML